MHPNNLVLLKSFVLKQYEQLSNVQDVLNKLQDYAKQSKIK